MATYANSGVNIGLGDEASKILYEASKKTWGNRKDLIGEVICPFDDFSGLRAMDISKLPEGSFVGIGFDGVGTKLEVAERMNKYDTIAYDLVSMVCDDAVVRGTEPVLLGSILDVNTLGTDKENYLDIIQQIADGYIEAANIAQVALFNGELAELGNRVKGFGEFNLNWGASVLWIGEKNKMFTGDEIKEGDKIIGLKEDGFRSNGFSLVRKVFKDNFGDNWHNEKFEDTTIGEKVLMPTRIFCSCICDMFGKFGKEQRAEIHGVAHITGGGLPGKIGRILKASSLGADISDPFDPPNIMTYAQKIGDIKDEEIYRTWCMGQGMVVVSPDSNKVIEIAKEYNIEAKVIGEVVVGTGVKIKSKGIFKTGEYLDF